MQLTKERSVGGIIIVFFTFHHYVKKDNNEKLSLLFSQKKTPSQNRPQEIKENYLNIKIQNKKTSLFDTNRTENFIKGLILSILTNYSFP